jgi:hypothetical protein
MTPHPLLGAESLTVSDGRTTGLGFLDIRTVYSVFFTDEIGFFIYHGFVIITTSSRIISRDIHDLTDNIWGRPVEILLDEPNKVGDD